MLYQDGARAVPMHSDHEPVAVYQGRKSRNLFDTSFITNREYANGSFVRVNADGSITTKKVAGDSIGFSKDYYVPAGTYTLSNGAGTRTYPYLQVGASNPYAATITADGKMSVTFNESGEQKFYLYASTAQEYPEVTIYPMLNEGSAPLPYEPYGTVTDTIFTPTNIKKSGQELTFERSYNHQAEMEVAGKSEQVQLTGKNLCPNMKTETTKTMNGVTYTRNNDGSIAVKGTASGTSFFSLSSHDGGWNLGSNTFSFDPAKTYKASGVVSGVFLSTRTDSGGYYTILNQSGMQAANSVWCREDVKDVYIQVADGKTVDTILYPQIELGSTATTYEPYCGGIPSPSPDYPQPITSIDSVELASRGRNLLNITHETFMNGAGKVATVSIGAGVHVFGWSNVSGDGAARIIFYTKGTAGLICSFVLGKGQGSFSFDAMHDYEDAEVWLYANGGWVDSQGHVVTVYGFQLEQGSTAHPYEPYHSTTSTIDLQGHQLRSLHDGTADELMVKRDGRVQLVQKVGHVRMYDLTWRKTSVSFYPNGYVFFGQSDRLLKQRINHTAFACTDYANYHDTYNKMPHNYMVTGYGGVGTSVWLRNDDYTDVADLVASFGDATLNFPLATPVTIDLGYIDPLPTYWPTTVIYDQDGNDISCWVKVVE